MIVLRYKNGKKYEKDLCDAEIQFLEELDRRGFEVRLWHHEHYMPVYSVTKDGVSISCKLYTSPRCNVMRQVEDMQRMYDLKAKIKKLKEEGKL